jgi:hypothetical protein
MNYKGSCHCGQISFEAEGTIEKVIDCNCSHCSRKGYLLWFIPRSRISVKASDAALATYTFNRHVIKHHFCANCGCAPFGFGAMPDGTETAAVNVRCIEGIDLNAIERQQVDGRSF